jgi:hypothetical protein
MLLGASLLIRLPFFDLTLIFGGVSKTDELYEQNTGF